MSQPNFRPVYSSHIDGIAYDADTDELHVRYKNGKTSVYSEVPEEKFIAISQSPSIGSAIHALVRGQHPHRYGVS